MVRFIYFLNCKPTPSITSPFQMKNFLLCFLLLISIRSFSQTLEADRLVLINLFNATNGTYWNNNNGWSIPGNPGDNPCGWYGISCEGGRVTTIAMSGNNMIGKIPESVTTMDALKYFYVANNYISGSLPSSIGNMTNLRHLEMSDNAQLKGGIPASIGNLHLLELLSINNTNISGNIPLELGTLTHLKTIGLSSNQLFGPIPGSLGNLSQLSSLFLERNKLSGDIPNELGNAMSLTSVNFAYNQLTGPIPSSIGNLTNLGILYLESNNLSGPLPDFNGISSSCEVNIAFNHFTFDGIEPAIAKLDYYTPQKTFSLIREGSILRAITGGTAVNNVYRWYKNGILVATNNITDQYTPTGDGTYKAYVSNSKAPFLTLVSEDHIVGSDNLESDRQALLAFYLETNGAAWTNRSGWNYPGNAGDSPCGWYGVSCTDGRVTGFNMNANNLSGTITPNIKNLKKLRILDLSLNGSLWGEIPSSLGEINELESLTIQGSNLTGILPSSIGNLSKLRMLDLSSNQLGGAIPFNIGNLGALERLSLAKNEFGGNIPLEIGGLANLTYINLYDNLVTGQIPSQLGNLSKLSGIDLSANQLSGQIPAELGNITKLHLINLNLNQLSDSIPSALFNATELGYFGVGHNSLSGSIPSNIGNLTKMQILAIAGNQFEGSLPASLGNLTLLEQIFLDHNNFTGVFPAGSKNWNNVSILRANHNRFDGILSLSSIPVSAEVNFNNNFLTFDAIEPNISKIDQYFSQAIIPLTVNGATISVNAGGTVANNTYRWFRNNTLIDIKIGTNTYTMTESGRYWVQVTNNLAPALTLESLKHTYNNPLPVTLVNFTAKKSGETNLLRWSTTSEVNNSGFEIERSIDAKNFEKIGFRKGKGESRDLETYQFVDEQPLMVSYYRLNQIDVDGKSTYSRIVQVNSAEQAFKLYPNPAKDIFTIESNGSGKSIEIYDMKGMKIFENSVNKTQTVSTENWPSGTYIIKHGELSKKIFVGK